jgi:hypothetical protein
MIIFLSSSYAQKGRFGFQAGGTLSWIRGGEGYPDSKIDFTAGVLFDIAVKNLVIQPQLNYVTKGGVSDYYDSRLDLGYIEMPVNIYYRQKPAQGFFIGGGPYFGFAVSGKIKSETNGDREIQFGNEYTDDYHRFDFGINLVSGYLLPNGLQFAMNYSAGLNNISTFNYPQVDGINPFTRNIGLRLSYLLK